MAITYYPTDGQTTEMTGAKATSITITKPTNIVSGDLMVASIALNHDKTASITGPTGWTKEVAGNNGTACSSFIFYKIAGGSEPANYAWSWTTSDGACGSIERYDGVDGTTPIDVTSPAVSTGGGTNMTMTDLTTVTDGAYHHGACGTNDYTSPLVGISDTTDRRDLNGTTTGAATGLYVGNQLVATAGAIGVEQATQGAAHSWVGMSIAIRPSTGGGGGLSIPVAMNSYRRLRTA